MDRQQKKIINELATKYDLTVEQVVEIIESPFSFIREKITSIEFTGEETEEEFKKKTFNFNIPRIGKLYASYNSFSNIQERCQKEKQ